MFLTLDRWYKPDYILSNAIIVCKEKELEYISKFNGQICFLNDDAIELSSSEIRSDIDNAGAKNLLSPEVFEFINKNGLYRKE